MSSFSCKRCAYQWDAQKKDAPKDYRPKYCPHCKSPLWDKDYVRGPKKALRVEIVGFTDIFDSTKETLSEFQTKHDPVSYAEQVRLAMEKLK